MTFSTRRHSDASASSSNMVLRAAGGDYLEFLTEIVSNRSNIMLHVLSSHCTAVFIHSDLMGPDIIFFSATCSSIIIIIIITGNLLVLIISWIFFFSSAFPFKMNWPGWNGCKNNSDQ